MKERFKVLDIFRGVFSSFVVFFHMSGLSNTPVINNSFFTNADLFVDFFFVLSGFVIAHNYQWLAKGSDFKSFFKKRFWRLYPLHLIILLIFTGIELSKHFAAHFVHVNKIDNSANNVTTFLTNLFLLNSVKFPGVNDVSWNIASWSISAEMIAYLVFALVVILINRTGLIKARNVIYLLLVVAAGGTIYYLSGSFKLTYSFNYGFLRSIAGFFTGVICYNAYRSLADKGRNASAGIFNLLEPVLLIGTLILVGFGDQFKSQGYIYEVMFFITILVFAFEKGWISGLFNRVQLLHSMGKYSYSIYMIHTLLLSLFNVVFIRVLKFQPSAYSYLFIVNYVLIYVVAAWTFKHIEMRFNLSSKGKENKTAQATA